MINTPTSISEVYNNWIQQGFDIAHSGKQIIKDYLLDTNEIVSWKYDRASTYDSLRLCDDGRIIVTARIDDNAPMGYFLDHMNVDEIIAIVRILHESYKGDQF